MSSVLDQFKSSSDAVAVEKVVNAIYTTATDGTDQLRYQPTDDNRAFIVARRECSEEAYQALVRGFFLSPSGSR